MRKAFSGLCMAILKSTKTGGNITVEASSPGLTPASFSIVAKEAVLRPQVAIWEREVPVGQGITGLWRPAVVAAASVPGSDDLGTNQIFTFMQNGTTLTGVVEGRDGGRKGDGETPAAIVDGKVDSTKVTFRVRTITYSGTVKGNQIVLQRSGSRGGQGAPPAPAEKLFVIGPPPEGSDPSSSAFYYGPGNGEGQVMSSSTPLVLVRVKR
jgi:beta-galactosidase